MKITGYFSELDQLGKRMLPEGADFTLPEVIPDFEPLDFDLVGGIRIEISELDSGKGLISFKGRQVLLYIRDHSRMFDSTLSDPVNGNKYHIAWCKVLHGMREEGRFVRYHATNRLDGLFEIDDGLGRSQDTKLNVCKICLEHLNYQGSSDRGVRKKVFRNFILKEFFAHYSTCFIHMPKGFFTNNNSGYTEDWADISRKIRTKENYKCGDCGVDMSSHKNLCDVHHRDGVKYNNLSNNLEVVCRDCHRKKPKHGGMFLSSPDMKKIQSCRLQQKLLTVRTWEDVYSLTDTSLHGDIKMLESRKYPLPQLCYPISDTGQHDEMMLDAAWIEHKTAINLGPVTLSDWKIFSVGEAVAFLSEA